jgi:Myosin-like coiled-coil protein
MRTKELEVQYNMARYDRERKAAEQEMARSRALNAQILTFSKTEAELRSQLNIYVDKFKQVRLSTCDIYVVSPAYPALIPLPRRPSVPRAVLPHSILNQG